MEDNAEFNWYPGHIAKAERQLKEKLVVIDIIIELRDARIPESSRHRELKEWAKNKPVIVALNKVDLADPRRITDYLEANPEIITINSKQGEIKNLVKAVKDAAKPIEEKNKSKGFKNKPIRVVVVGYPNIGKSSLINKFSKTKKAKVANKAGVTRQQQWIKIDSNIQLLDTPGIIPSKLYSKDQALKLAMCNCLGEHAYDDFNLALDALKLLEIKHPGIIKKYYEVEDSENILKTIALKRNWLITKNEPDLEKTATKVLFDIREGNLEKIFLD